MKQPRNYIWCNTTKNLKNMPNITDKKLRQHAARYYRVCTWLGFWLAKSQCICFAAHWKNNQRNDFLTTATSSGYVTTILLFWVYFLLKSLLSSFTYAQNVPNKLWGEYLMKCFKKEQPIISSLIILVENSIKTWKV